MIDLEKLSELYGTAHDVTKSPAQRQRAAELLAEIDAHKILTEYMAVPESSGDDDDDADRFTKAYDNFTRGLLFWLVQKQGESNEEFYAREERLKADKVGIIVRHFLREKAKPLRTTDFDFVNLCGHEFHLALWPPHASDWWPNSGLPPATPNEVFLT
jgi:hypothetical protein